MKIFYTKHAEDKLKRRDIKSFKITKKLIDAILSKSQHESRTKYGDYSMSESVDDRHDVRIVYDIIGKDLKVITFHISRKGRYK